MKLPHEQLILLVLANCADPSGVAFAEWPGREHWWKYLVDRTRMSKSSLFRHINTLVDLGLCTRSTLVMADGTKRPTIRLDLEAMHDIDEIEASHSHQRDQSHGETEAVDDPKGLENDSDISDSHGENFGLAPQSHGETIPTGGTGPFPIVGMHKDSSLSCSKENPPTPQGGTAVLGFEDFKKAWLRPIERPSVAQRVWDHVPTARRGEAIAAAKGYFVWVAKQRKEPALVSAQTFLRETSGWPQWLAYAPYLAAVTASMAMAYPLSSEQGKALATLHEIAGLGDFLRSVMTRQGSINYRLPISAQLFALSNAPPRDEWRALNRDQAGAWEGLLRETITVAVRTRLREGSLAPWPFPPSVTGKIYPWALSDDDLNALASEAATNR